MQVSNQMGNATICVFSTRDRTVISGITSSAGSSRAYIEKSQKPDFEQKAPSIDERNRGPHRRRNSFLMAKVTVDGKTVEVPNDANALEACRAAGVDVPHFCYHPALSIVGQCRMCMVEVEGVPKIQASCTVPVRDGMVIKASTEKALAARNATMEFLLINHPLDCPICDQAGECKLQDNAFGGRRLARPSRGASSQLHARTSAPRDADMTRCMKCARIRLRETETGSTFIGAAHTGLDARGQGARQRPLGARRTVIPSARNKKIHFRKRVTVARQDR